MVETKTNDITNVVKVETKSSRVELVRLETILLGDSRDTKTSKEVTPIQQTPTGPRRLRPRNKTARHTRIPRNASRNKQYAEELGPCSSIRHLKGQGKITRPSAGGPSNDRVKAQTQRSESPSINLPALPSAVIDPYEEDTEIDLDAAVETPSKPDPRSSTCPKKGTIDITQHGVKRKMASHKYRCKECDAVMDSVHELTMHHQSNHNICSTCKRPYNNPMSLSQHEYEHKKKNLQCPKCDQTFTFESQVKAHMYSHCSKPSFFCVYPKWGKAFFNESDLTRHFKRHTGMVYKCIDCPYQDTDKRNYDSHRLSHSRITKYKCETCSQEFVFNTQKRRHLKDGKCPIKRSDSPAF